MLILLQFASILTALCVSATFAAEREYIVPMEKSQWLSTTKKDYECTLSQIIPFYGEAKFTHKSGHKVKFNLFSDEPVMDDNVTVVIQSEPPAWRHDDKVFEVGKFDFQRGHNPLIVQSPYASRMLQQVENGMSPVVIYRDMADGRDIIAVMLSPINFRQALAEYRACEKTLLDFDLDEIKNLKLYFATNKDILTARSKRDLKNIIRYLKMDPGILQVKVDAHADSRGRRRFNDDLSERRSAAVVKYLLSTGIKAEMIYSVNHGEREPEHTNKTAIGRSKNRRADVQLLTTAPPTAEERKAIEAAEKAERRRQLTERSIFNRPSSTEIKPEIDKKQEQNDSATQKNEPEVIENIPQALPDSADYDVPDDEPPAPNFINFDHLVDKNNQKVKSK
ncbi:MAG: OmpA family protein [gamma proteobacterium symbiont of Lucinoma myriamae]|nr:OmpA family protein [gamma proteobacterium symbiont of Lucinoma myriamae]